MESILSIIYNIGISVCSTFHQAMLKVNFIFHFFKWWSFIQQSVIKDIIFIQQTNKGNKAQFF